MDGSTCPTFLRKGSPPLRGRSEGSARRSRANCASPYVVVVVGIHNLYISQGATARLLAFAQLRVLLALLRPLISRLNLSIYGIPAPRR